MKKGNYKKNEIEIVCSNVVFKNRYVTVFNDDVIFPSGYRGTYVRLETPELKSAGVLPVREDGKFGLVKNYRHGARGWCYEMVKGGREKGETLLQAAQRELKEEAGLSAEKMLDLGEYSDSPAIMSGRIHCFIAKELTDVGKSSETTEAIEDIVFFDLEEYKEASKEADFSDALTELIIYKYVFDLRKNEGCL